MARPLRCLCALLAVVASTVGSAATASPARLVEWQSTNAVDLDLAAMVPRPSELGLAGFVVEDGLSREVADKAAELAAASGKSVEDRTALLQQIGWVRSYRARFLAPDETGDPFAHLVVAIVVQYTDGERADAGFQAQMAADTEAGVSDVIGATAIGDDSGMRRIADFTLDEGAAFQAMLVVVRRGAIVAYAYLFDRGRAPVDQARGEAVAAAFLSHVDDVVANGGPGLSRAILRVQSPNDPSYDNYVQLDGIALRRFDEEDADFAARQAADAGAQAAYDSIPDLGDDVEVGITLLAFADAAAAERWLAAFPTSLADNADLAASPSPVADGRSFGDASLSLTIAGDDFVGDVIAARVGTVVAAIEVDVNAAEPAARESAEALMAAQLGCLETGTCPAVPVPAALEFLMAAGTPTP